MARFVANSTVYLERFGNAMPFSGLIVFAAPRRNQSGKNRLHPRRFIIAMKDGFILSQHLFDGQFALSEATGVVDGDGYYFLAIAGNPDELIRRNRSIKIPLRRFEFTVDLSGDVDINSMVSSAETIQEGGVITPAPVVDNEPPVSTPSQVQPDSEDVSAPVSTPSEIQPESIFS